MRQWQVVTKVTFITPATEVTFLYAVRDDRYFLGTQNVWLKFWLIGCKQKRTVLIHPVWLTPVKNYQRMLEFNFLLWQPHFWRPANSWRSIHVLPDVQVPGWCVEQCSHRDELVINEIQIKLRAEKKAQPSWVFLEPLAHSTWWLMSMLLFLIILLFVLDTWLCKPRSHVLCTSLD